MYKGDILPARQSYNTDITCISLKDAPDNCKVELTLREEKYLVIVPYKEGKFLRQISHKCVCSTKSHEYRFINSKFNVNVLISMEELVFASSESLVCAASAKTMAPFFHLVQTE